MSQTEALLDAFSRAYDTRPSLLTRAPGRVNLIGEHTDYNEGFVFPAAITYRVMLAAAPRRDRQVRLYSVNYDQGSSFHLDRIRKVKTLTWSNYVRGVAWVLENEGYRLSGMDAAIAGDVPVSSGLSSSAALEVASCLAFEAVSGLSLDPKDRALLCQRAEREFVGVQCGIMDQFISSLGRRDHALFLDTRTLRFEAIPLPQTGIAIVIGNTRKPRGLVDSAYNERRAQCEEAVDALKPHLPGIRALRDVTMEQLLAHRNALDPIVFRRARHVVTENERVLKSVEALRRCDVVLFGRLMNESHESLRADYEVSCHELDVMVAAARGVAGVYGSRMTGAGFGGCTVSLVASEQVDEFRRRVGDAYRAAVPLEPEFYICQAADGAQAVSL